LAANKVDEIQAMQLEEKLISLEPISFDGKFEEYMAIIKDIQLNLGKCGKYFLKKNGYLIELIMMNLKILLLIKVGCH
jgi:hypothetical protein